MVRVISSAHIVGLKYMEVVSVTYRVYVSRVQCHAGFITVVFATSCGHNVSGRGRGCSSGSIRCRVELCDSCLLLGTASDPATVTLTLGKVRYTR